MQLLINLAVYDRIGIDWGLSIFAFVFVALMPIPWLLFKYGPIVRARSQYDTHKY